MSNMPVPPPSEKPKPDDNAACATPCCGESQWPAGEPLVLACQLCPKSPTYWRKSRT